MSSSLRYKPIPAEITDPAERVRLSLSHGHNPAYKGVDRSLVSEHLRLVSATASPPASVWSITIPAEYADHQNLLHTGAAGMIFDITTSTAMAPVERWYYGAVSRNLNYTLVEPIALGVEVFLESVAVHVGDRMASVRGTMKDKEGKLLGWCEHLHARVVPPGEVETKL